MKWRMEWGEDKKFKETGKERKEKWLKEEEKKKENLGEWIRQ